MMQSYKLSLITTLALLAGCAGGTASLPGSSPAQSLPGLANAAAVPASASLTQLVNLDYSNGSITVFSIANGRAQKTKTFTPGGGHAQGLAVDAAGRIYTTLTESSAKPCSACVEVFTTEGKLVEQLDAPILSGAPGAPSLTDVALDRHSNVYVSDYGQQAVYYFPHAHPERAPVVVVQNSSNAASVLATPSGNTVIVSGGCGFASVRPYARTAHGQYTPGGCFSIGTIALIGGAADENVEAMTPVDGAPGLVSVSSPSGGNVFHTPGHLASISGVAFNRGASVAFVANHQNECVYAFARPKNGWLSGKPKLLATYKGFKKLDIIAVPQ
jgi:hypothetical protein